MSLPSIQEADLERVARKRAGAKLGWYVHASVYMLVNLSFVGLALVSGRDGPMFPALGWGLGLAIHGVVVFLYAGNAGLLERMVQRERNRLELQRDPW